MAKATTVAIAPLALHLLEAEETAALDTLPPPEARPRCEPDRTMRTGEIATLDAALSAQALQTIQTVQALTVRGLQHNSLCADIPFVGQPAPLRLSPAAPCQRSDSASAAQHRG
jgi:hypothetical protein